MDATNTDIHILHIDGAVVGSTTDRAEAEIMLGRALEIVSGRIDRAYLHTIESAASLRTHALTEIARRTQTTCADEPGRGERR